MLSLHTRPNPALRAALVWFAMAFGAPAFGGNPYHVIFERNPFHLRPPPSAHVETPREPLPRVRLTGITTILRGKRALLIVDFPTKPLEKPKEESYILAEGQRAGSIEVLAIDEKTAHVKVDDSGTITNLTFEKITPGSQGPAKVQPAYGWGNRTYQKVYR